MAVDPNEAYRAAKAARDQRLAGEASAASRQAAFPARAEQTMREFAQYILDICPNGLEAEAQITPAGGLKGGIKGVLFKVKEDNNVVFQGSINCRNDEQVFFTGYYPDGDRRQQVEFGSHKFDHVNKATVSKFMTDLISKFIN